MSNRLHKLAAAFACGIALTVAAPIAAPTLSFTAAAHAGQVDEFRSVLARYGSFQTHARYGEVWVPAAATAPAGWHPYPPCHWVQSKDIGWYYDDKSAWGRIVHHYGRWAHDQDLGWVWVAGEEFSPGWVVWRTSDKWVGWAPLPPDQDVKTISADSFNSDKHWTFMDASKFGTNCADGMTTSAAAIYPTIIRETRLVTEIRFVRGIAIFVLPPALIINVIDIDIDVFTPWAPCFLGSWFWNWNFIVNTINVVLPGNTTCPPRVLQKSSPIQKIISDPPPSFRPQPRPGHRVDLVPTPDKPGIKIVTPIPHRPQLNGPRVGGKPQKGPQTIGRDGGNGRQHANGLKPDRRPVPKFVRSSAPTKAKAAGTTRS